MRAIIAAVLGTILAGCATTRTEPVGEQSAETMPEQTAAAWMAYDPDALDSLVESLEARAQALPGGGTTPAHRDAMHAFFAAVVEVLPVLEGPDQSGGFLQQLRAVESARDRLSPDVRVASIGPAINSGLRATSAALHRIGRDEDVAGQTVSDLLSKLSAKIDEWEQVRAVGRPYIAADAGRLVAQIARQMADRLAGRATDTPAVAIPEPATEAPAEPAPSALAPTAEAPAQADVPAATEPAATEPSAPLFEIPDDPAAADVPAPAETDTPAPDAPAEQTPAEEAPAEPAPAEELNK